jgi:hypothetical protein
MTLFSSLRTAVLVRHRRRRGCSVERDRRGRLSHPDSKFGHEIAAHVTKSRSQLCRRLLDETGSHVDDARMATCTLPRHRALLASLAICFGTATLHAQTEEPKAVAEAPKVDAEGFISLFNGKDLTGWTPKIRGYELGVNHGNTFRVHDGAIQVGYEAYEEFGAQFGHLFHETEWSSYVMRLEYRFLGEQVKGGAGWALRNSGIMVHGQSPASMRLDQDFPVSIEVQLLGGDGKNPRTTANLCTPGTNVVMKDKLEQRHCISSSSKTFHGEQWVTCEVEVRGGDVIRHRVNGELVLEYQEPQLDPRDGDAKKIIEARGGEKRLSGGSISLQSESHPVEFRNIRIKPLSVPETDKADAKGETDEQPAAETKKSSERP